MSPIGDRALRRSALMVCRSFVAGAPIDGAAFTQMTSDSIRDPWVASDAVIAELELIQYNLGEGPTLDAFRERRPVLVADLAGPRAGGRWPMFIAGSAHLHAGALFALPMQMGAITAGVCAVYRRHPGALTEVQLAVLLRSMDDATLALLALRSGAEPPGDADRGAGSTLPRGVHQATGMLVAQLGVDAETAFARLRAHAYLHGTSIHTVADDIVERRLRLEVDLS